MSVAGCFELSWHPLLHRAVLPVGVWAMGCCTGEDGTSRTSQMPVGGSVVWTGGAVWHAVWHAVWDLRGVWLVSVFEQPKGCDHYVNVVYPPFGGAF